MAEIILFEHANFHGAHKHLYNSESNLAASDDNFFNDKISSFVISSGTWQFFVDTNYSGAASKILGPGMYNWVESFGISNDTISSVKCCSTESSIIIGGDKYTNNGVVTDNMLLYLDAASYQGFGNWLDQSGNHHHAQFLGATRNPKFVLQPNNGSYFLFDSASSQYFDVLNQETMVYGTGSNNPRTLSGWINVQPTSNWQWLFTYGVAATGQTMCLGFTRDMTQVCFSGYGGDLLYPRPSAAVWAGQWINICGTYSGTTAKIYINGQLVTTGQFNWSTTKGVMSIGRQTNGGEFANGKISQVSCYSKELSADEVLQNYNALKVRYGL
jgi:hypothetical protein